MKSLEQLAKEDFESYRGSHPRGHDIPKWEQLSECVKASWIVRDKAIHEASEKKDKRQNLLAALANLHVPQPQADLIAMQQCVSCGHVYHAPAPSRCDCLENEEGKYLDFVAIPAAVAQADALDADRYRWLRSQPLESDMFCTTIWRKGSDGFGDDLRLEELDAAIDAAIAAAKEMK